MIRWNAWPATPGGKPFWSGERVTDRPRWRLVMTGRFFPSGRISALRELEHPGLPRYYEQFQNEQMLCIVREYIEGESLDVYARERQLTRDDITGIMEQLCDILQVLHTHQPPVVHRDIKPENIIVRPDGQIVLIDFDIAREVKEGAAADTVFFGTGATRRRNSTASGRPTARADIYALRSAAAVAGDRECAGEQEYYDRSGIFRMLSTGVRPFRRKSGMRISGR